MTDRDRALAQNKHEAQEATYIALDRLRRLMIGRRIFGGVGGAGSGSSGIGGRRRSSSPSRCR